MHVYIPTLTDYILEEQRRSKKPTTGSFSILLHQIENAAKIIASHVKATGLVDLLGRTGDINTFGEEVQKLDAFSNTVLRDLLLSSGEVFAIVSEEEEKPIYAPKKYAGEYIIYFDPLDGSSNIDIQCPIGTIFSIYKKTDGLLQPGTKQIAAGYILYGSSVMFVYSSGQGVQGFTLDPAVGNFVLSHKNITIPQEGIIYSINEGYEKYFLPETKKYLTSIKSSGKAKGRYIGSLVADAHRTLLKGGIFLYPADKKQERGKLRLMIEVNPIAFLVEQAGGLAIGENLTSPLQTVPKHIHERSPFVMGSKKNIKEYVKFFKK